MVQTVLTDLSSLYPLIYDDSLFVAREQTLMAGLVTVKNGMGYAGRKINIREQATATTVADGTSYTPERFNKTNVGTITPGEVMASHDITRQTALTDGPDDIVNDSALELGMATAEKVDTDLISQFANFSTTVGAAGASLTLAKLGSAASKLLANKARGQIYGVLHPYQWHDIWVELGTPAATNAFLGDAANEALRQYAVAQLVNAMWFTSANVAIDGNDDSTGGLFNREALILDVREDYELWVEDRMDTNDRKVVLSAHMGYGYGEQRDQFGVGIISDATEPA